MSRLLTNQMLFDPLSVANGGTGRDTLTSGSVLLGNGTNAVNTTTVAALRDSSMGISDYVVEKYIVMTNNGQSYRKWNSGILEIWYLSSVTQAVQTAWGNIFRSTGTYPAITYTVPFTGNPVVSASLQGASGCWLCADGPAGSATASPTYRIASPVSTPSFSVLFTLYAFGRWK